MTHKLHPGRTMFLIIVLLLTLTTVFSMSMAASTPEPEAYFRVNSEDGSTFYFVDKDGNPVNDAVEAAQAYKAAHQKAGNLPATYDARDYNLVTTVKNQGNYGNCWAFAATSVMETNAIKKGLMPADTADFSELHLAWFAHNPYITDTSDPTYGDGSNEGENSYDTGGNYQESASAYMRGSGPADEADFPYTYTLPYNLPESDRYNQEVLLQGCYRLDTTDSQFYSTYDNNDIKQAILDYGSVQVSYLDNENYYNYTADYTAYYNNTDDNRTNHAVTIVGWDDNFSRTNFKSGRQPSSNGAWIIKNSWGNWNNNGGYMYISYADKSLGWFAAYETQSLDAYDNLYNYNGIEYNVAMLGGTNGSQTNVFTTEKAEKLTKVGFYSCIPGCTYKVNVYTDIPDDFSNPTEGSKHENVALGTLENEGYYTIDLTNSIELDAGETYAVELILINGEMTALLSWEGNIGHCLPKQSFGMWYGTWYDASTTVFNYSLNNAMVYAMTDDAHTHAYVNPVITAPTCTEQGYTTLTCSCGETQITNYTSALGHEWSEYSCADGTHTRSCTRLDCGEVENGSCTYGSWTFTTPATCTAAGSREKSCTVCADKITETVAALGHDFSNWVYNNGSHVRICKRDGCTVNESATCTFGAWVQTTAPTCTANGTETKTCSVCSGTQTQSVPALNHVFGDWEYDDEHHIRICTREDCDVSESIECSFGDIIIDSIATCTQDGSAHAVCSVCGGITSSTIPKLGHNMTALIYNNDGTHTSTCQREGCTYFETYDCFFASWTQTLAPTCTTAGTEQRTCNECGGVETRTIAALGHDMSDWTYNNGTHTRSCTRTDCTETETADCSYGNWAVTLAATCTADGIETKTCSVCGGTETQSIPATGHDMRDWVYSNGTHVKTCSNTGCIYTETAVCTYGDWTQTLAPTCTAKGSESRTCSVCNGIETREIAALGHDMSDWVYNNGTHTKSCLREDCDYSETAPCTYGSWTTVTAATCTENGSQKRTCSVCSGVATQTLPKLGHSLTAWIYNNGTHTKSCTRTDCEYTESEACSYNNWVVTSQPTCTADGSRRRICSVCAGVETQTITALGHGMSDWAYANGSHTKSCQRAGCSYSVTEACSFGEWTQTLAPTCTAAGSEKQTCGICSGVKTRAVAALGHDYGEFISDNNGKHTKTCTREGCTSSITADCSYEIHTTTASCTVPGITEYHCTVCAYSRTTTGTTLPHDLGDWTYNNGTHTKACANCDYTETADCAYGAWVVTPATCTENGSRYRVCAICEGTQTQTLTALGHDMSDWTYNDGTHSKVCQRTDCTYTESADCSYGEPTVTPATCLTDGSSIRVCAVCDGVETTVFDALRHQLSAWADNDGTHSRYCEREGCTFTESADCSYGEWIGDTQPSCTTAGSKHRICSVCGDVENESIPALGHDEGTWIIITNADCTNEGAKEKQCTRCNTVLDSAVISATGHTLGSWTVVNTAGCETSGRKQQSCTVCHDVINSISIPATGHTPAAWNVTKEATCTESGTRECRCSTCNKLLDTETIAAKGHSTGETIIDTAATCTQTGTSHTNCSVCGVTMSTDTIPVDVTAHAFGEWGTTINATCTAQGEASRSCSHCGVVQRKSIAIIGHTDAANDGYCDICGTELYSHEEPVPQTFIQKIAAFFQKIADFFRKLFGG